MSLTDFLVAHRRSLVALLGFATVSGIVAAFYLPVALFPNIQFPRIAIGLEAGDRAADQMEVAVTRRVEQVVRAVPGVTNLRSITSRGSAEMSVNFEWGGDMELALQRVETAIAQVLPSLPAGTTFTARRMDPTVFPVLAYSLVSDKVGPIKLRDIAQYNLSPRLSTIAGVAGVEILGGLEAEYQAIVDPARLAAYGLAMSDVSSALSAANVLQAVGRFEDRYKLFLVLADARVTSPKDIGKTVLKSGENGIVELEDVAEINLSGVPQWVRVTADGHDAVIVQIKQQPGGNTVQIVKDIDAALAEMRLPADVKMTNWYDQSTLIVDSASSVRDAILIGVLLAGGVLFVFLRSIRITFVALIVVPAVLAVTTLLLWLLGMSFNIMTLGGMAAAIGLIVDDAIVMIEQIERRLDASDPDQTRTIRAASAEFLRPLAGSSAATTLIFLPLAFLTGVTGAFFKALSITMATALAVSFLIAWLVIPILAEMLLKSPTATEHGDPRAGRISTFARRSISASVARPARTMLLMLPVALVGVLAWYNLGSGFIPSLDEGGFILDYVSPPGTSLTETDRLLRQIEGILKETPEVQSYSRRTGAQLGGGLTEANTGDFFVKLKPPPRRSLAEITDEVRERVTKEVPGLDFDTAQLMEDLIGDLTSVPQPVEVKLFSDDLALLMRTAPQVAEKISKVRGIVDVLDGVIVAGDAMTVKVDRARAALEGVDPLQAAQQIEALLSGTVATQVQTGTRLIGVRAWTAQSERSRPAQIANMSLRAPDGHAFPVRRIAEIHNSGGQPEIARENLRRMVAVTGRLSGRDLGSAVAEVKQTIDQPGVLPPSVTYELGGLYKEQQAAFRGLVGVFAGAVAIVFVMLLFLYERLTIALSILAMPLIAMAAVAIGLWLTGIELNIMAMMGMTMVVGIVTEVAIFYFTEYDALVKAGVDPQQALVQAGINRMRPIAMTTIAAILALLPLALAIGSGSQMQQPLAVAIVSGLLVQVPLVLLVMPALYSLLTARSSRNRVT